MEAVSQELQTRDEALRQLKSNLKMAQEFMVKQANKGRRLVNVEVGD